MKFIEDPRIKIARKTFALSWIYFTIYLLVIMGCSYFLGIKPYLMGLPRWVAIGNILVPIVFILALVFVIEKFIPDVPLTDDEDSENKE
ncbi:hypothetical protein LCGC14_1178050 [marine sediment metagenome]|uniref:DUF997 domain-containing protein n=1 Tax=marine sediment metagenome TaxID=412755 RepID=A0A0F9LSV0_9ZZZZ|nr:DUF997 family protein [Candidatus Aminicenantes bacterium]HEB36464.1 DUF997 family protein [Candidatus Aminicenantes bacterium]